MSSVPDLSLGVPSLTTPTTTILDKALFHHHRRQKHPVAVIKKPNWLQ